MKKAVVLGLSSLFLLTGCGSNKVTCSQSLNEAGMKIEAKIIATIKKDKVDAFEVVYNTDSKTTAQMFCTLYKDAKCSGKKVTIKGDAAMKMMGISKSEVQKTSKADFVKGIESTGFKCK